MRKILFGFILLLFLLPIPQSQAAPFTVSNDVDLIAAINAANSNGVDDVITLDDDIILTSAYTELDPSTPTDGVNGLPSILADGGSSLTIEGDGHTISRSGAAAFRIMHIGTDATVFINDLGIEKGLASAGGLGALGAGIFAVDLAGTRITLSIDNSRFSGNTAIGTSGLGAGIFVRGADFTLTNSTFSNNNAEGGGGGVYNNLNTANIIGNSFYNNTALDGAAMMDENSNTTLINNTFSGNTASGAGGGVASVGGILTLQNNTITGNSANNAGGIYNLIGTMTLQNNIIAGNNASSNFDCHNEIFGGAVMTGNSYNVFGSIGSANGCPAGINDIVPVVGIGMILDPLDDNGGATLTHALILGSPAIDAANNSNCPSTDQRGLLRGFDGDGAADFPELADCDIGAFEYSLDPAYDSNPVVGATINLGSTSVGTEISTILEISEIGQAALSVSLTSITGTNAADFSIIGLPTIIGNGNAPQDVAIICAPSGAGLRTATITFSTNDPVQPTVSYNLECTGLDSIVASASLLGINQIVTEDLTTLNLTVELTVPAGFSAAGDVTVEIVDAATGNATSGADYTAFPPTTLTFTGPLTAGTTYTQTIAVTILEDTTTEGAEALALQINAVTGAAEIGFPDTHTIVINDDDGIFAQASFVTNSVLVDEDEVTGTLSFGVQLFIPSGYSQTGDITLTISDSLTGTATSGADYGVFAPVTLTFVDAPFIIGTTYTQTVTVPILDDTLGEGAETFELAISGISGFVELLSPSFTGIINDDEIATVIVTRNGETITVTTGGGDTDFVFKTVDNPFATVGQTVTYTIRARNPKSIPLTQVVIYDVFDERLTDIQLLSTTHGAGSFNGNTLTVSGFTLQPNEEAVIVVSARIASLRSGDIIPNAAILESPNASVHVSNLATVGGNPDANSGGAAQVFIVPSQLPNTGETPFWAYSAMLGLAVLGVGMGFFVLRRKNATA